MTTIRHLAACLLLALAWRPAIAKVEAETLCFRAATNEKIHLVLRYYLDTDLNQQLGALAQYGPSSRPLISLAFLGDATSDSTLDWELHWLEIVDGRPGGTYALAKPKSATVAAAVLTYRNAKTGRETLFRPSAGLDGRCAIGVAGK